MLILQIALGVFLGLILWSEWRKYSGTAKIFQVALSKWLVAIILWLVLIVILVGIPISIVFAPAVIWGINHDRWDHMYNYTIIV